MWIRDKCALCRLGSSVACSCGLVLLGGGMRNRLAACLYDDVDLFDRDALDGGAGGLLGSFLHRLVSGGARLGLLVDRSLLLAFG